MFTARYITLLWEGEGLKTLAKCLLVAVFFYVYLRTFLFMNISFSSSAGVLIGSIIALLVAVALAVVTVNKMVSVLNRKE